MTSIGCFTSDDYDRTGRTARYANASLSRKGYELPIDSKLGNWFLTHIYSSNCTEGVFSDHNVLGWPEPGSISKNIISTAVENAAFYLAVTGNHHR
jgi:hypothetical protein